MSEDSMLVTEEFRQHTKNYGFPYCDECNEPAVWSEMFGWAHATDAFPYGVPPHLDTSGHAATAVKWWNGDEPYSW